MSGGKFVFAALFGFVAVITPALAQPAAGGTEPRTLETISNACVQGAPTGPDTVRGAYDVVEYGLSNTDKCLVTVNDAARGVAFVREVRRLVERDQAAKNCRPGSELAVCRALAAVALRAVQAEADYASLTQGRDVIYDATLYDVQGTRGGYAGEGYAFSFLRAALRRDQSALADKIVDGAELDYDDANNNAVLVLSATEFATPCAPCLADAREMLPAMVYARALEAAYEHGMARQTWSQLATAERTRHAQWEAYHFGNGTERVQLPWELLVNDLIYRAQLEDDDYRVTEGVQSRIPEPPTSAITLLHPSIGLTMKTREGQDTPLAGVVELIGYSKWSYDGETNKRTGEWGISAIAVYQPSDEAEDWGYGALVRTPWNNVNVAWVRTELESGDSDDALLFSVDVTNLLPGLFGGSNGGACRMRSGDCPAE